MAVAKPRNLAEAARVERGLKTKYPQMFEKGWGKPKKKKTRFITDEVNAVQKAKEDALKSALTGKDIKRMTGR